MIIYTFKNGAFDAAKRIGVLSPTDAPDTMHPTGGIADLPGVLSTASSWLVCYEQWPDRAAKDAVSAEIHLAVYADHCFTVVNDNPGRIREVGIFPETLFAEDPDLLKWLRPNTAFSVEYIGLRWVVPRELLEDEVQRIVEGLGELAGKPGTLIPTP